MVWYSYLEEFSTVCCTNFRIVNEGFSIVNEAEVDVFLELSCFSDDPTDVGSDSTAFSKSSLNIWKITVHIL